MGHGTPNASRNGLFSQTLKEINLKNKNIIQSVSLACNEEFAIQCYTKGESAFYRLGQFPLNSSAINDIIWDDEVHFLTNIKKISIALDDNSNRFYLLCNGNDDKLYSQGGFIEKIQKNDITQITMKTTHKLQLFVEKVDNCCCCSGGLGSYAVAMSNGYVSVAYSAWVSLHGFDIVGHFADDGSLSWGNIEQVNTLEHFHPRALAMIPFRGEILGSFEKRVGKGVFSG